MLVITFAVLLTSPYISADLQSEFHNRVTAFINGTVYNENCGNVHHQVLRLSFNDTEKYFCAQEIIESLAKVNSHEDVIDFELPASVGS